MNEVESGFIFVALRGSGYLEKQNQGRYNENGTDEKESNHVFLLLVVNITTHQKSDHRDNSLESWF
jgi:hypothetical protein